MIRLIFFFTSLCFITNIPAQPLKYSVANIHAHNDYDHNIPFTQAYGLQIGSIEADVLWIHDTLFVAHSAKELKPTVLFESSYLRNLEEGIKLHNGYSYTDTIQQLQLLIDVKTDSLQTLDAVISSIKKFPLLLNNRSVRFVITGRQPVAEWFNRYPSYILFDGKINDASHLKHLDRIALFSADFSTYSKWKGEGPIPENDLIQIKKDIAKAHALHKPFRFWGVPDNKNTWLIMIDLGVDYINTDHIRDAVNFIRMQKQG